MQNNVEDHALNPFPWYQMMRDSHPIHYYEPYRTWQVFRYNDVQRVLTDHAAFSSNFSGDYSDQDPLSASLISMDPPRHRELRNLVTQAFTPRAVGGLQERITTIVSNLLDGVATAGRMDVIDDLAYPLPVIVIAEMLGIPQEDRARFKIWSDAVVGAGFSGTGNPQAEMSAYFLDMIGQRRREAKVDLISALLAAEVDGVHLSQRELLGFCILLLVAGNETTTNLIGNAILCFNENPGIMERLQAEPDLIPAAIEEVLRYRSPVQMMYRRAVSDVDLGGKKIGKGEMVLAQIGSANRDGDQFPHPDRFDIGRAPNRHLAFGHGIHFCLGAPLARMESRIALSLMLQRLGAVQVVEGAKLQHTGSEIIYGVRHLPVTFTAAA